MPKMHFGLDIGNVAVRAVALSKRKGVWRVERRASVQRHDDQGQRKPLALVLAEISAKCRFKGPVTVQSSDVNVLVRYIPTVPMPEDRLQRLLRLELQQHAGTDGDLAADTCPLPIAGDEIIHCCAIAQPGQIKDLITELTANDIKAENLHVGSVALGNALPLAQPLDPDAYGLQVDIGGKITRLVLHRGDTFIACRQISFGGDGFTEALAKEWKCSFPRAEAAKVRGDVVAGVTKTGTLKRVAGDQDGIQVIREGATAAPTFGEDETPQRDDGEPLFLDDSVPSEPSSEGPGLSQEPSDEAVILSDDRTGDELDFGAEGEDDLFPSEDEPVRRTQLMEIPDIAMPKPGANTMVMATTTLGPELTRAAEQLVTQVASSLQWFRSQLKQNDIKLSRIEVSGGGAMLQGLPSYLERRLGASVTHWQPVALDGDQGDDIHTYATAIGLAMTTGDRNALALDLRPESTLRKAAFWSSIIWPYFAAAMILMAGTVLSIVAYRSQAYYSAEKQRFDASATEYREMERKVRAVETLRNQFRTDLRGIGARIFAGRDMLMAIRALKQMAPEELWITTLRTSGVAGAGPGGGATINRGMIRVTGRIKPQEGKSLNLYEVFNNWYQRIGTWQAPGEERPFFQTRQIYTANRAEPMEFDVGFAFDKVDLTAPVNPTPARRPNPGERPTRGLKR